MQNTTVSSPQKGVTCQGHQSRGLMHLGEAGLPAAQAVSRLLCWSFQIPQLWALGSLLLSNVEASKNISSFRGGIVQEQKMCKSLTTLYCKEFLTITALAGSFSQTWDKKADTTFMLILYKFLYCVSFSCWLGQNIYAENNPSQDLSTENCLITKLASDSCMRARISCLVLGSHANREELSCFSLLRTNSPYPPRWSEEIPEGMSQHHTVCLCGKITRVTKKWKERLHNGYFQISLTCYQQKSTPWHGNKSIFLCMMKHRGAICSQCVACVSGCKSIWKTCCTFLNVASLPQMFPSA